VNALVRLHRHDGGATLVEFAIVAPVLLLLLIGCLDFSRALNAYVTITNAAREGARYASLDAAADGAAVKTYLTGRVAPLDASAISVTLAFAPAADARWSSAAPAPGHVTVSVSYPWQATTWLIGSLFSASGTRTLTSAASMEAER
jgi:Flp pilus assembly protein TadG